MSGCHVQPEQMFNLVFGYNASYAEFVIDANPGAGIIIKLLTVVPTGEVWVIQEAAALNVARAANIQIAVYNGTNYHPLVDAVQPAANRYVTWTGAVVLGSGEYVAFLFLGTTAGDDLYWSAHGYKMKLTQ